MRLTLTLVLALWSLTSYATMISKYYGKVYPVTAINNCEQDFDQLIDRLERQQDFILVEGGCVSYGEKHVKMQFSYSHPITKRLERFEAELSSDNKCSAQLELVRAHFERAGMYYVSSYCDRTKLVVDFTDSNYLMIRNLKIKSAFLTKATCEQLISTMIEKLYQKSIFPIITTCEAISLYGSTQTRYRPTFYYSSHFSTDVNHLVGRSLTSAQSCEDNRGQVTRDFTHSGIEFVHLYCSAEDFSNELKENIVFITKKDVTIRSFAGNLYKESAVCSSQLVNAKRALEVTDKTVIYSYCKFSQNKFQPVLNYFENK